MAIKKKDFSLSTIANKYSSKTTYKPDRFFDLGDAFLEATGFPGPVMGHINMFLGHSDTGKTTALLGTAADAIKKGDLPIFIITEQKFDFEHAKIMGIPIEESVDKETGEVTYTGDYIFRNDFQYIEQITDFINHMLDEQDKGELPYNLVFLWDSVGSVPCKMTFDGKGGKQHNASVLSDKIGMGINQRISGSRRSDKPYTNTLVVVNQPWVELPDNIYGQPKIKAKGGESMWLNSTLVFLFGNEKNAGITKIDVTTKGKKIKIGNRSKVSVLKNHVNSLSLLEGKIMVTSHGFRKMKTPDEEKNSKQEYLKTYWDYISKYMFRDTVASIDEIEFGSSSDDE